MSKYDNLKYLKKTKARNEHICNKCNNLINLGDFYYAEMLKDRFLYTLHNNKFCNDCYKKFGDNLIK